MGCLRDTGAVPERLPSGIVTFVFTDIEGSTRLYRQIGDRYPALLERHRQLLREAWQAHRGCEVKTEGDAFFVAFTDAGDAIVACAEAQRAMADEQWPPDAMLRVRMGVHAGLAYPRDGDYIAFAVHQAARVVGAANGGQVVVSAAAAERATGLGGVGLVSSGRYRVRDFDEPVELFLVDAPGVAVNGTPLRVLPAERHNLVRPITMLVGRDPDVGVLAGLVTDHRLVSVVGPGGLGKTRLVIEYGLAYAEQWEHGVWLVDLGRVSDPAGVDTAVAEAVGAPVERDRDPWVAVLDHLREREVVVLMDNCEHLVDMVVSRVDSMLRSCPGVRVLATSREPLGIRSERVWRPDALAADSSAVELFCQRAGLDDIDAPTREAVVELCGLLDGLPLAIELAAARADVATPAQIVSRLTADRGLGHSRDPGLDARQRSLEGLIGWSYELLTAAEQTAFCRLGVFVAGFDLAAAGAAVAPEAGVDSNAAGGAPDGEVDAIDAADLVWSLLAKSLIAADPAAGTTRYRMLVTVRAYARRVLVAHDELTAVASRVARHYLRAFGPDIDKADPDFYGQRAREIDNLRHLIGLLAACDQPTAQALACAVVIGLRVASPRQSLLAGRSLVEDLDAPSPERVALLTNVATSAESCGDSSLADELLESAMALRSAVGEPPWLEGTIDQQRGIVAVQRNDPRRAVEIAIAGLAHAASPAARCRLYNLLGIAQMDLGDFDSACRAVEQALELSRGRENYVSLAADLCNLAENDLRAGDLSAAAAHQHEALDIASRIGHSTIVAFSAIVAARILGHQRGWARATRLQAAADGILTGLGVALYPSDRQLSDDLLAAAAEQLGADQFEHQLALGAGRPIEETIAETQAVLAEFAATPP